MKNKFVLLLLIFLVLAVIVFVVLQITSQTKKQAQTQENNNAATSYETKTDEQGEVIVEVTPVNLSPDKNISFSIRFTTHSVNLDYDIVKIAKLADDKENVYKPISWTGGLGGHHILGKLTFPAVSKEAKSVTLTIPQIDNHDRIFSWNL